MRRCVGWALASIVSLGFSGLGGAMAADMAVKARPPIAPPPIYTWSGCYLGADVGGGSQRQGASEFTIPTGFNAGPTAVSLNKTSVMGGPYAGCNYQFGSNWVIGVEGDWSAAALSSTANAPNNFLNGLPVGSGGVVYTQRLNWLASIRGRVGYAVVPNVLLYVTGGAAWGNSDYSGVDAYRGGCPNCSVTGSFNNTSNGWVAGGGVEWAPWNNNWIVRAEGLYYSLSGASAFGFQQGTTTPATTSWTWNRSEIIEGRVGVSYKFGGPIVAKY
jgi:outer membrane immunogenic protein